MGGLTAAAVFLPLLLAAAAIASIETEDDFNGTIGSDDRWSSTFYPRGFTQSHWECTNFPDGPQALYTSGDTIIVGGPFTHAGDRAADGVAIWDGSRWSALGPDSLPVDLHEMALYHGHVVVAGFGLPQRSYRLAFEWSGGGWQPLGDRPLRGQSGQVQSLIVHDGDLLAGGAFAIGDSAATIHVARWDGSEWRPMGSRLDLEPRITVYALGEYAGSLYAGGIFWRDSGADSLYALARWDGSEWQAVPGLARYSWIRTLTEYRGDLIAAGTIYLASDPEIRHSVAKWDGQAWEALDADFPSGFVYPDIRSFIPTPTALLAAGDYSTDASISPLLASLQDAGWVDERPPMMSCGGGYFTRIAPYKDGIIAVGPFLGIGDDYTGYIAYRDADGWHPVGPAGEGLDDWVDCFLPGSDGMYVGGGFAQSVSGETLAGIARWDGSAWHALGDGLDGTVSALAWYRGHLIAGGRFTSSGAAAVSNIAEWDGQQWLPLSVGTNGPVNALQVYKGDLYAGGSFTQAGDQVVNRIARWDGSEWHPVAAGVRGNRFQSVASLAVFAGELIVAGDFYLAGDVGVPGIARWDGNRWSSMGRPTWAEASSLVLWNGKLVASGTPAPGSGSGSGSGWRISIWDGFAWTDVVIPMFEEAAPLGVYKGNLLVTQQPGGYFPGLNGRHELLALWDESRIYRLGSGINGDWMRAAGVWNGGLYLGGEFRHAGGKPSRNIAFYSGDDLIEHPSALSVAVGPSPFNGSTTIVVNNPVSQRMRLDVIDILGRTARSLTSGPSEAGASIFTWDGRDKSGNRLPSGRYFLRMETLSGTMTKDLMIVR